MLDIGKDPLGRNGVKCVVEAPKAEGSHDHHNRLET